VTPDPASLDGLPAALALEADALCDDFERHWRRARRRGTPPPDAEVFVARAAAAARPALRRCLAELERELRAGPVLPEVPGLVVEEEIGRGGMGVVYRTRRAADGRAVALKLIPGAEHARWSRWLAELADLRHPNLVPLEAFGTHDGLHYVVMPLVPGGDLKERLGEFTVGPAGGPPALRRAAGLLARVAGAVAFLHGRGILHRDLKPSNILLASAHGHEPLVCDFGLAGRLDEASAGPAHVLGTPPYMAPEQTEGRPLGAAADVWGLGAVLYELLAGRPPFVEPGGRLNADRKRSAEPAPPPRSDLSADVLGRICLRCLRRDPAARYPTAAGLADDLRRFLDETSGHPD
jgi:eukaryotic-like serine/threonine-protein kinase